MSAETSDSSETDRVIAHEAIWSNHALNHWTHGRRNDVPEREPDDAYREAVPVHYPSARGGCWGRYHPDGDCILILTDARKDGDCWPLVKTVIDLSDRSVEEQRYVRQQAENGGVVQ